MGANNRCFGTFAHKEQTGFWGAWEEGRERKVLESWQEAGRRTAGGVGSTRRGGGSPRSALPESQSGRASGQQWLQKDF